MIDDGRKWPSATARVRSGSRGPVPGLVAACSGLMMSARRRGKHA